MSAPEPSAALPLLITVLGEPAPQGSKSAFAVRKAGKLTGQVAVVEDSKHRTRPWRAEVTRVAREAMAGRPPLEGPLAVRMTFTLRKPSSAPKRKPVLPCKRPDSGKIERACSDSLTDAGVWRDDAQVVEWYGAKCYPAPDHGTPRPTVFRPALLAPRADALDVPGVVIRVWQVIP